MDRFVHLGVIIHDDGVFAAHFGDHAFDMILALGHVGRLAIDCHAHAA